MNPTELLNLACVSGIRAKNMIEEKQNVLVQAQADLSKEQEFLKDFIKKYYGE